MNASCGVLPVINEHHILGEKNTGFELYADKGPFECGNCRYYKPLMGQKGSCRQTEMVIYSRQPRIDRDAVIVGELDCCEYVERIGGNHKEVVPEL